MSSLFTNTDKDKFQVVVPTKDGGGERKTTWLQDKDGDLFSLETLKEEVKNILKERKEDLEKVMSFGSGLLNKHDEAFGFMIGVIVSKIITAYEIENKTTVTMELDSTSLSKEEMVDSFIEEVGAFQKFLIEHKDDPDLSLNNVGLDNVNSDLDGTGDYA